jgi:hypothetical protein
LQPTWRISVLKGVLEDIEINLPLFYRRTVFAFFKGGRIVIVLFKAARIRQREKYPAKVVFLLMLSPIF